jgi:putative effector of murein hydrolase
MLGPATIALGVPLFQQGKKIKRYFIAIITGVTVGCILSITMVIGLSRLFGFDQVILVSLVPKSITTPMGIALCESLGGNPSVTVLLIVLTGICGAVLAPWILKIFRVKNKIAKGIGIGTAAHALGTSKAMEMGKTEGAMSGAAIGIAGLVTVFIAPFLVKLFEWLLS